MMQQLHLTEVIFQDHFFTLIEFFSDQSDSHCEDPGIGDVGAEEGDVGLVIDEFAFLVAAGGGFELAAAGGIPRCNHSSVEYPISRSLDNIQSHLYHDLVEGTGVSSLFEFSFFSDSRKPLEHVFSGNSDMVES